MDGRRGLAIVGGAQGLALWLLTESWPEGVVWRAWATGALYFIVASGLVLHFARSGHARARLLVLAAATGLAFGAVAVWVGLQLPPEGARSGGDDQRVMTWALGAPIALYVLGPFLQVFQATGRARFPYPDLYRFSWNNFFIAVLGLVYTGALWAVLLLWSQLFDLIGIGFFEDLFTEEVFVFIATGAAIGYGLAAARENERVIGALRGLTQALLRAVLPLLAAVTIAFLLTLPATGLEPLFGAKSAASVLLWWLVFGVVFLNAVYLDGERMPPYGRWIRRLVEAGILATPLLGGLALYAVWLRIDQHGLTPERMYAALLAVVLGLYASGYAVAVVLRAPPWLGHVRQVNVIVAWLWVGLAFAVHTPLLDPLRISLDAQLRRLEEARVDPLEFDFAYLRFHLGARGAAALDELAARGDWPTVVSSRIAHAQSDEYYELAVEDERPPFRAQDWERIPESAPWPDALAEAIRREARGEWQLQLCSDGQADACLVMAYDLDGDGVDEELAVVQRIDTVIGFVFARRGDAGYARVGKLGSDSSGRRGVGAAKALVDELRRGEIAPVAPRYSDLEVDGRRWRFSPF